MSKVQLKTPNLNSFIVKHLYIVEQEAKIFMKKRSLPHFMDFEELISIGNRALCEVAKTIDFSMHEKEIISLLHIRIGGSFIDYMRAQSDTTRNVLQFMKKVEEATKAYEAKHKVAPSEKEVAKSLGVDLSKLQQMKNKKYHTGETVYLEHKVGDHEDNNTIQDYLSSDAPTPLELLEKDEIKGSISRCFKTLSKEEKFLVQLFYGEDYKLKEIAGLYFVSEQAIYIKLKNIYEKMKVFLQKEIQE